MSSNINTLSLREMKRTLKFAGFLALSDNKARFSQFRLGKAHCCAQLVGNNICDRCDKALDQAGLWDQFNTWLEGRHELIDSALLSLGDHPEDAVVYSMATRGLKASDVEYDGELLSSPIILGPAFGSIPPSPPSDRAPFVGVGAKHRYHKHKQVKALPSPPPPPPPQSKQPEPAWLQLPQQPSVAADWVPVVKTTNKVRVPRRARASVAPLREPVARHLASRGLVYVRPSQSPSLSEDNYYFLMEVKFASYRRKNDLRQQAEIITRIRAREGKAQAAALAAESKAAATRLQEVRERIALARAYRSAPLPPTLPCGGCFGRSRPSPKGWAHSRSLHRGARKPLLTFKWPQTLGVPNGHGYPSSSPSAPSGGAAHPARPTIGRSGPFSRPLPSMSSVLYTGGRIAATLIVSWLALAVWILVACHQELTVPMLLIPLWITSVHLVYRGRTIVRKGRLLTRATRQHLARRKNLSVSGLYGFCYARSVREAQGYGPFPPFWAISHLLSRDKILVLDNPKRAQPWIHVILPGVTVPPSLRAGVRQASCLLPAAHFLQVGYLDTFNVSTESRDRSHEQDIVAEHTSRACPNLNNVRFVADEALFSASVPQGTPVLSPNTVPRQLAAEAPVITADEHHIQWSRKSQFTREYPWDARRLVERFTSSPPTILLEEERHLPGAWAITLREESRQLKDFVGKLAPLDGGATNPLYTIYQSDVATDLAKKLDTTLARFRSTGKRGDKLITGWEAEAPARVAKYRGYAALEVHGQRYFTFFYNLWTLFFSAMLEETLPNAPVPNADTFAWRAPAHFTTINNPDVAQDPTRVGSVPATFEVQHLSAKSVALPQVPPAPPVGVEGEGVFWDNGGEGLQQVADGEAVFVDADGLSREQIALCIRAFAPQSRSFSRFYGQAPPQTTPSPSRSPTPTPPKTGSSTSPAVGTVPLPATTPVQEPRRYYPTVATYGRRNAVLGEVPGVSKMFLHHGNSPMPHDPLAIGRPLSFTAWEADVLGRNSPVANPTANWNNSPWLRRFRSSVIAATIRHFVAKHHCGADAEAALDAVYYRTFGFRIADSPNHRNGTNARVVRPAFGANELSLPRDFTLPAYLDAFRLADTLSTVAPNCLTALGAKARHLVWTGYQGCFSVAASITWAAHLLSVNGQVLHEYANPNPNVSQYIRNLVHALTDRLWTDSLTVWNVYHKNATYMMYNFCPLDTTIRTSAALPLADWANYTSPFLVNAYHELWSGQVFPHLYELPSIHQGVLWPAQEDKPLITLADPGNGVRLARDLPPFAGRAFLQDGGSTANLQYYVSVAQQGNYRHDAHRPRDYHDVFAVNAWNAPFQQELPVGTNTFALRSLSPMGTAWADYVCPGSVATYDVPQNRIRALGVSLRRDRNVPAGTFDSITRDWLELSAPVQGDPRIVNPHNRSPCIGYVSPFPVRFDLESPTDFSMAVWADKDTQVYTGLSFWTSSDKQNMLPGAPTPEATGGYTYLARLDQGFPSNLMNAQPPPTYGRPVHTVPRNRVRSTPQTTALREKVNQAAIAHALAEQARYASHQAELRAAATERAVLASHQALPPIEEQEIGAQPSPDVLVGGGFPPPVEPPKLDANSSYPEYQFGEPLHPSRPVPSRSSAPPRGQSTQPARSGPFVSRGLGTRKGAKASYTPKNPVNVKEVQETHPTLTAHAVKVNPAEATVQLGAKVPLHQEYFSEHPPDGATASKIVVPQFPLPGSDTSRTPQGQVPVVNLPRSLSPVVVNDSASSHLQAGLHRLESNVPPQASMLGGHPDALPADSSAVFRHVRPIQPEN